MSINTVKALVNGVETTLTYNSSTNKYEATIQAPALSSYNQTGHYYDVSITATDTAGNSTTIDSDDAILGNALKLVVKERVAPVLTIIAPTTGSTITNNRPTIQWTVTDNDSGVDLSTIKLTINGTAITAGFMQESISDGYKFTYTPTSALSDGNNTIKVDAKDNDGNAGAQKTVTFKVDTTPPTLTVSTPENNSITNNASCIVSGVTNDATSSPVTVTVKVNSGAAESVTVNANGSFSRMVTIVEGVNTIIVVATDGAGKFSTVTRTVTLDTAAPVISAVTITPNPVDAGLTYIISVAVAD